MESSTSHAPERNPFGIGMAGGLVFSLACFILAALRRPPDLYLFGGGAGLVAAAVLWSWRGALAQFRQGWEDMRSTLARLEAPAAAPVVEATPSENADAEQRHREAFESRTRQLRRALEEGLQAGFAALTPGLSQGLETATARLDDGLRTEREDRAREMRELQTTLAQSQEAWAHLQAAQREAHQHLSETLQTALAGLQTSQREAAQAAVRAWEEWRAQAAAIGQPMAEHAVQWQAAADRVDAAVAALPAAVAELSRAFRREADAEWNAQLRGLAEAWDKMLQAAEAQSERSAASMTVRMEALAAQSETAPAAAAEHLRAAAEQAQAWLGSLQAAGQKLEGAFAGAQRFGEEAAAHQADLKAVVEMLERGMTGVLDRLQALGSLGEGHAALLEKMHASVRRFEERAAELLEENSLKAQEALLEVLERTAPAPAEDAPNGDPDLLGAAEDEARAGEAVKKAEARGD